MPKFYKKEIKLWATQIPIKILLDQLGESYEKSGKEYRWIGEHSSLTFKNNLWYHHASQQGGNTVSFLTTFCNMTYEQAMMYLTENFDAGQQVYDCEFKDVDKPFEVPKRAADCKRMFAYLCKTRCIDSKVVSEFYHRRYIYQDIPYNNVVFAGYNESKKLVFAQKKGTIKGKAGKFFQQNVEGSNWNYGFRWEGFSDRVYIFEAPIDMLAFISLNQKDWQQHSYIALCGLSSKCLIPFLNRNTNITKLHFCLDHDIAGSFGANRIICDINNDQYTYRVEMPKNKDWDEDLMELNGKIPKSAINNIYPNLLKNKLSILKSHECQSVEKITIMNQYLKVSTLKKSEKELELIKALLDLACAVMDLFVKESVLSKENILCKIQQENGYRQWRKEASTALKDIENNINQLKLYFIHKSMDEEKKQSCDRLLLNLCGSCLNAATALELENLYPRQVKDKIVMKKEQTCLMQSM